MNSRVAGDKSRLVKEQEDLADGGEIGAGVRAKALERVSESAAFQRAPRLRELLLHIGNHALTGDVEALTEQRLGRDVFGRADTYNPAEDSIVRAQVRLLRRKLDQYFESEGKDEPVVLSIPRGAYMPVWAKRGVNPAPLAPPPAASDLRPLLVAAAIAAAFGLGWWISSGRRVAAVPPPSAAHPLLASFFDSSRPTFLVLQDASTTLLNNSLRTAMPLNEFQDGSYRARLDDPRLEPEQRRLLRIIDSRQYTSFGDLAILLRLWQLPGAAGHVQVVSPRHLHLRQLKGANAILVGGAPSNPWIELYQDRLAFRLQYQNDSMVRNLHPIGGEEEAYRSTSDTAYGVLAMMPNVSGEGRVLLMAGTSLEATEAASELAIAPEEASRLRVKIQALTGHKLFSSFQAIVRARRLEGTSTRSEVVALRAE